MTRHVIDITGLALAAAGFALTAAGVVVQMVAARRKRGLPQAARVLFCTGAFLVAVSVAGLGSWLGPLPLIVAVSYGLSWRCERQMERAPAPEGVRLILVDGTRVPCGVLRDRDLDRDGLAAWAIVPLEDWHEAPVGVEADMVPARTTMVLRITAGRP
ncbi:MAG: hypothetical protein ACRDRJ_05720 [Streptosporangiaceae bacterium]